MESSQRLFITTLKNEFKDLTEKERALVNWMFDIEHHCSHTRQKIAEDFMAEFEPRVKGGSHVPSASKKSKPNGA